LKRIRQESCHTVNEDLKKVATEQVSLIESLKLDKSELETKLNSLKTDQERVMKENQILRRAVMIQQERHTTSENELKVAHKQKEDADERIRSLEQMILSLRYRLQAQQSHCESDFMHHRSPDVF
jgi:glycerol-3-phosphate dehydrogenase